MLIHHTSRILLMNPKSELFLFKADNPVCRNLDGHAVGPFWFTVGGKLDQNESYEDAAIREAYEETGFEIELGEHVLDSEVMRKFEDKILLFRERYYLATTLSDVLSDKLHSEREKSYIVDHKWWPLKDLQTTTELIYPKTIANLMEKIILKKIHTPLYISSF